MTEPNTKDRPAEQQQAAAQVRGVDWYDPTIPAGDAPPMPRWPLYAAAAAFGLWLVFLVVMVIVRMRTTAY
jgi:hypothetical protein